MIERICVVGLGEVGRILVEDLLNNTSASIRVWDCQFSDFDSPAAENLRALESDARVSAAKSAAVAAQDCQLVLSVVTAAQAVNAAESVAEGMASGTFFVDLNSVSPGTKRQLSVLTEEAGARFVEAAVMSPIMPARSASPIILSCRYSAEFAALGAQLGFSNMRAVSEELGVASATKMCRSVIVKGMEALVTESLLSARHYGVEDAVLESLENLFPGPEWPQHARYLISRTLQHGERRADEMFEAAKTVEEAGYSAWMCNATVMRQAWAPQFSAALEKDSLEGMLDAIRCEFTNLQAETV